MRGQSGSISKRYAHSAPDGERLFGIVRAEFERTRDAVLGALGVDALLAHAPVIGRSIEDRNPGTDVLNLAQIELLRRHRQGDDDPDALRFTLHASVNALAAAMQSTG